MRLAVTRAGRGPDRPARGAARDPTGRFGPSHVARGSADRLRTAADPPGARGPRPRGHGARLPPDPVLVDLVARPSRPRRPGGPAAGGQPGGPGPGVARCSRRWWPPATHLRPEEHDRSSAAVAGQPRRPDGAAVTERPRARADTPADDPDPDRSVAGPCVVGPPRTRRRPAAPTRCAGGRGGRGHRAVRPPGPGQRVGAGGGGGRPGSTPRWSTATWVARTELLARRAGRPARPAARRPGGLRPRRPVEPLPGDWPTRWPPTSASWPTWSSRATPSATTRSTSR